MAKSQKKMEGSHVNKNKKIAGGHDGGIGDDMGGNGNFDDVKDSFDDKGGIDDNGNVIEPPPQLSLQQSTTQPHKKCGNFLPHSITIFY